MNRRIVLLLSSCVASFPLAQQALAGGPGPAGVETCAAITSLGMFSDIAQYAGTGDDYNMAGLTCAGDGEVGGPNLGVGGDLVYAFRPSNNCTGVFFANPSNLAVDTAFYVVTDCSNLVSSCVAIQDSAGPGMPEGGVVALTAGTTYYFIVDVGSGGLGGQTGTATAFQTAFQAQIPVGACGDVTPVELLDFSVDHR